MELTEKAQLIGISVLISLVLGGGGLWLYKKINPSASSSNDGPIIMAGGSLYIATPSGFWFSANLTNPNQTTFPSLDRNVFQIDVSDLDATGKANNIAPIAAGSKGVVEMDYCNKSAGCGTEGDQVKITWDNTSGKVTLSTGANEQLPMITPNLRVHSHKGWVPTQVIVTVDTVVKLTEPCNRFSDVNDSGVSQAIYECTAIVHTCATSVTCTAADATR